MSEQNPKNTRFFKASVSFRDSNRDMCNYTYKQDITSYPDDQYNDLKELTDRFLVVLMKDVPRMYDDGYCSEFVISNPSIIEQEYTEDGEQGKEIVLFTMETITPVEKY